MPKREMIIFTAMDLVLVIAAIIAVFHHVRIGQVMLYFIIFSVLNGIVLIVAVVRNTKPGG